MLPCARLRKVEPLPGSPSFPPADISPPLGHPTRHIPQPGRGGHPDGPWEHVEVRARRA